MHKQRTATEVCINSPTVLTSFGQLRNFAVDLRFASHIIVQYTLVDDNISKQNNGIVVVFPTETVFSNQTCFLPINRKWQTLSQEHIIEGEGKGPKIVVRPAMIYGMETVGATSLQMGKLGVAEMRMLRMKMEITKMDKVRNECVRRKVGVENIEEKIREARLR